jgi:hypothetical protein
VVISGTTNLPDGLKMWIHVEDGKLPLGAPKSIAFDEVYVQNGKFSTQPLWMEVPNTQFTKRVGPRESLQTFASGHFSLNPTECILLVTLTALGNPKTSSTLSEVRAQSHSKATV